MKEADDLKERGLRGFNTWYNNSVLSHVLLPEGITINLAFKFYNTGQVLRESLIGRFGNGVEEIRPGPRSYDGTYTELRLRCAEHEILVQSAAMENNQYLLITPVRNVKRSPSLLISAAILWNKPGYVRLEAERLLAYTPGRNLEIRCDGKRERQMNTGLTNPYLSVELSGPAAVSTDKGIGAAELRSLMEEQKKRFLRAAHNTEIWRRHTMPCEPALPGIPSMNRKKTGSVPLFPGCGILTGAGMFSLTGTPIFPP
jgi:hypothetical protein